MNFSFFSPVKIIFGQGESENIFSIAADMGKKCLIVTGKNSDRCSFIFKGLEKSGIKYDRYSQKGEPAIEQVAVGAKKARRADVDFVIAIGGGSVIDASKAIAALVTNKRDIMEYLEVIGQGRAITKKPSPLIVLPTTSGTGAEVTCNAVLASQEHGVKVSMRSQMMYPDVAIVDPSLTQSMPKNVTAFTGMDALTQLIESFVSKSANPYTDALCKDGIARISRSFKSAFDNGEDLNARTDISLAALFSGIALANAKLGAVHGIAGPMGGMIKVPHGLICARLLALVMEENVKQLRKNDSHSSALIKFQEVAGLLTDDKEAAIEDGTEWIRDLVKYMKIPCLSDFGLDRAVCRSLGDKALKTSSIKGNPVELTREQITAILEKR